MNEYRITATGLPLEDTLVLRSALHWFVETGSRWRYVDDIHTAHAIVRWDSDRCVVEVSPHVPGISDRPGDRSTSMLSGATVKSAELALPLRARDLLSHLRRLEFLLGHVPAGWSADAPPPRLPGFVGFMLSAHSPLGHAPTVLRLGSSCRLLIDARLDGQPRDALNLRWRSWSIPSLQALREHVTQGTDLAMEIVHAGYQGHTGATTELPLCAGSVRQLVWVLAAYDPQPLPVMALAVDTLVSLHRWPDFGDLPVYERHVRLAALLARAPMTLVQLTRRSGLQPSEALAFLNACHWHGLLKLTKLQADTPKPPLESPRQPASPHGWSGLVRSIRTALRGGNRGST